MVVSLFKLAEEGKIEKTGAKPKLPIKIDGVNSRILDVYKIPLKYLFYNDKNGRISSTISKYESSINPVSDMVDTKYNNLIESIIEVENKNALNRTQNSIEEQGQQVYGWVLDDGRIIDGNRRFTALRSISKKTGETAYFEAVILPFSYGNDSEKVKIKQLELAIQMGVENREDYDPVDLAVDIYHTTAGEDPIMTREDYARGSHMRPTEVEKYYQGAICMKEFLEFIGAPTTSYDIIKEGKSWSLFYEMGKTLNSKYGNDPESQVRKNETKESYFGMILYQTHVGVIGNTARTHLRDYGKYIVSSVDNNNFNNDVQDVVEELSDSIQDAKVKNYADLTKELYKDNDLVSKFGENYNDYMSSAKSGESVDKLINTTDKSVTFYKNLNERNGLIGNLHYNQFSNDQLKKLQDNMRELTLVTTGLFEKYGKELK